MQKRFENKGKEKRTGQVREERVNGAPVYTAIYKVNHSDELMEFLLRKCNTSRNNVKSLLVRRQVLVNGSVVTQYNFALAKDDEVKLSKRPVKEGEIPLTSVRSRMSKNTASFGNAKRMRKDIKVLFENEEFLAVDKPEGLLSVESDKDTESAFLYAHAYLSEKNKNARPFVLHRIDKETSGVLLFAKDIKIHSMLRMKWGELVKTREYYAVCEGIFEKKSDTILSYLKENKNNLMYSTQDPTGQKAITKYEVIKESENYSLLRVYIETGRKNQIRVHMQALGHPIVGDDKYGHTKNPLGRLGLHASKLELEHPKTGEIISVSSPLPPSFKSLF